MQYNYIVGANPVRAVVCNYNRIAHHFFSSFNTEYQ